MSSAGAERGASHDLHTARAPARELGTHRDTACPARRSLVSSFADDGGTEKKEESEEDKRSHARYVIVVEHDLAVLDYMSDYICCLYGEPGAYGVVTKIAGVRNGINNFLAGYIPVSKAPS